MAGWAAIIAFPTAITGFYGQNVPFPGFSQQWGFAMSTVLIVVMAFGSNSMFHSRRWL